MFKAILSRQAVKDLEKLKRAGLSGKAKELTDIVEANPYQNPPPCEKLVGSLKGYYSRRINEQHRFVYTVVANDAKMADTNGVEFEGIVRILRMWMHYE